MLYTYLLPMLARIESANKPSPPPTPPTPDLPSSMASPAMPSPAHTHLACLLHHDLPHRPFRWHC